MTATQPSQNDIYMLERKKKLARAVVMEVFSEFKEHFEFKLCEFENDNEAGKIPNIKVTICEPGKPSSVYHVNFTMLDLGEFPWYEEGVMKKDCREVLERHAKKAVPRFKLHRHQEVGRTAMEKALE